ncbi:MAG: hypothetical protein ACK5MG_00385 [Bacteroidales bacterium]
MKICLLATLLLMLSINIAKAQFGDNNAIYLSAEGNIGNYFGCDLNLNYVCKEKYSFKLGYIANTRKAKSQPEDYTVGAPIEILSLGLIQTYDKLNGFQIGVGRIYKLNPSGTIRANLSVGLAYTIIEEPENWKKVGDGVLTENYTWNYDKQKTVSLIINPKIEFPITRVWGLTVSPMLQINKDRTYYGIGVGQMLGLLRKRRS